MSSQSYARSFLIALVAARKSLVTYPPGHDMQVKSLEALRDLLAELIPPEGYVEVISTGMGLKVGSDFVAEDDIVANEFLNELAERRFSSLKFSDGIRADELGEFLRLMSRPSREIIMAGGYPQAFEETGIDHIRPTLIQSAVFDEEGQILVNGQSLDAKLFSGLEHPSLVQKLIRKLVALQAEDEQGAVPSDVPLEQTLANMDRIVQEQILNGVPPEDVIDALVTPDGLQRFKMKQGSSGLEKELNAEIENADDVEERALFVVELMRTMGDSDRYDIMVKGFVNEVNGLVESGMHSNLLSRLLVFMLEERRHEVRRERFNRGMNGIELDAMVDFVFTRLDRTGTFEEVILGTMLRSFGLPVAQLVIQRYFSATDDWTRDVAFSALIHGSRYSIEVLLDIENPVLQKNCLPVVRLGLEMGEDGQTVLERLASGDAALRGKFYWALGKLNDVRALPWLERALGEESVALRKTGLSQLEHLETTESIDLLLDFLVRWESGQVAGGAVDEICLTINALARLRARKAVPHLHRLASQRAWFFDGDRKMIKSYARFAIQKIEA